MKASKRKCVLIAFVVTLVFAIAVGVLYVTALSSLNQPNYSIINDSIQITNAYTNGTANAVFVDVTPTSEINCGEVTISNVTITGTYGKTVFAETSENSQIVFDNLNVAIPVGQSTTLRLDCDSTLSGDYTVKVVATDGTLGMFYCHLNL
jgi:hypothetical protein